MSDVFEKKEVITKKTTRFAGYLIAARKNKKLSQKQVATAIGLSGHTAIHSYESGNHFPPLDKLVLLCELLDVSPNWLLDFSDNKDLLDEFRQENKAQAATIKQLEENLAKQIKFKGALLVEQKNKFEARCKELEGVAKRALNDIRSYGASSDLRYTGNALAKVLNEPLLARGEKLATQQD